MRWLLQWPREERVQMNKKSALGQTFREGGFARKQVLGRGLSALIPVGLPSKQNSHVVQMALEQIIPNPYQPRKFFDESKLKDLVESIREHGIIQPIVVTQVADGYQIVVGERRWRAAKAAGFSTVPVIIKDLTPQDRVAIALVENLQRHDLNALEEAQAFHFLVEGFGLTQENLGKQIGRSRPYITNMLRLLNLPETVKTLMVEGKLSPGHARTLLSLDDEAERAALAKRIVLEDLSVRQTENLVKLRLSTSSRPRKTRVPTPLEKKLQRVLRTHVRVHLRRQGGKLEISYSNARELEDLANLLVRFSPRSRPLL